MPDEEIQNVPLEDIDLFVNQSREEFGEAELRQLAADLKTHGQLQAGVAWYDAGRSRLVLICGERRYRALKLAGIPTMAVKVIRGNLTPGQMLQMNLAENLQRASLNPIERGKAFRRIMQLEDLNASEVALRMSVSNATVSRDLSLLDLPESLQSRVASGQLPASVAAAIARVGDEETRRALADQYENGRSNRDGIVSAVHSLLNPKEKADKKPRLALKLGGLSISVTAGKPDKLNVANLFAVFDRVSKEAKSLKDCGKSDVAELAQVLKAS
jgi:ParB family transcriptional regulator, chromosome partitioning protein